MSVHLVGVFFWQSGQEGHARFPLLLVNMAERGPQPCFLLGAGLVLSQNRSNMHSVEVGLSSAHGLG